MQLPNNLHVQIKLVFDGVDLIEIDGACVELLAECLKPAGRLPDDGLGSVAWSDFEFEKPSNRSPEESPNLSPANQSCNQASNAD